MGQKIKQTDSGFTLIELMIATTLFTIIMMMGVGSLVVSSNAAKAAQKLRIAVDNVNFAMESMTRELRMGTYYYCGSAVDMNITTAVSDCPGNDVIAFTPQKVGDVQVVKRVAYKLKHRDIGLTSTLVRCEDSNSCTPIVSEDVDIKTLKFFVKGADSSTTNVQPSARILITGSVTIKNETSNFSLQTMASQRSTEK